MESGYCYWTIISLGYLTQARNWLNNFRYRDVVKKKKNDCVYRKRETDRDDIR